MFFCYVSNNFSCVSSGVAGSYLFTCSRGSLHGGSIEVKKFPQPLEVFGPLLSFG